MDARGDAMIVWRQPDEDGVDQIFKSEYRGGSWSHPASLADHISPSGEEADRPHLAMDATGNAIVVWQQYDGPEFATQVFMSEHRHGAWDHPSSLTDHISPSDGEAYDPHVAMAANGDAIVVWEQSGTGGGTGIGMSEYR